MERIVDLCSIMDTMKLCTVNDCGKRHKANGYCHTHNERVRRTGSINVRIKRSVPDPCAHKGCQKDTLGGAHGYCRVHSTRVRKHGCSTVRLATNGYPVNEGVGHLNKDGYRLVTRDGSQMMEHRWVMEQHLGRRLVEDENVHHKNGIRDDNRISNLELWSCMQPSGKRVEDLLAFAAEIMERYANERTLSA